MSEMKEFAGYEQPEFSPAMEYLNDQERKFMVENDQQAEWCMDKIAEAYATIEKWTKFYTEQLNKVKAREEFRISWMEQLLKPYFYEMPHKVTKTQESYALPSGKLMLKNQAPEYERDDDLIVAWLKANGEEKFVKTKETVDWAELKKTLSIVGEQVAGETGEIIPGIIVKERKPKFVVEVK